MTNEKDQTHQELIDCLVQYAKVNTRSDKSSTTSPSTEKQKVLGKQLCDELVDLGLEAYMDDYGYVYGELKGDIEFAPAIGFIAHLDTEWSVPASGVSPRVHRAYRGGDITLEDGVVIAASELKDHINDTIITSDGRTLLGGDDKAGISVIMSALAIIKNEWKLQHGDVYVMFNPDEEMGRGTEHFDRKKFPVAAAYTMDGDRTGEIGCETFYGAKAEVTFKGTPTHPGEGGYQKLVNPIAMACSYETSIPAAERPETTRGKFGFYHPNSIEGNVEQVVLKMLIRDFDKEGIERRKDFLTTLAKVYNNTYGEDTVKVEIQDQYPNMRAALDKHPDVVQFAVEAMKKAGIAEPARPIIRGGTDGAALTVKHKIPTPNISVGAYNIHSVKEFASLRGMITARDFILNVVKAYAAHSKQ